MPRHRSVRKKDVPKNHNNPKKITCSYFSCNRTDNIKYCKYCKEPYCPEHINPTIIGMPNFKDTRPENIIYMEKLREKGHPCYPYSEIWRAESKIFKPWITSSYEPKSAGLPYLLPPQYEITGKSPQYSKDDEYYDVPITSYEPPKGNIFASIPPKQIAIIIILLLAIIGIVFILSQKENPAQNIINIVNPPKNCTPDWMSGKCYVPNKPWYCDNGNPVKRPDKCGCPDGYRTYMGDCIPKIACSDGTLHPECSTNKPYQCINGTLVEKATECGCPEGYLQKNDSCKKIQYCSDGTMYDECSANKPMYCINGVLTPRATVCGCPEDYIQQGDSCVSRYMTFPKEVNYNYVLRGNSDSIQYTVYGGLKDYLASQPRYFICYGGVCPSIQEQEMTYIDEPHQKQIASDIAQYIQSKTSNLDDQARIAISLVQNIPYDYDALYSGNLRSRYPYEVLYDKKGVCGEKAKLLAFILRELGYGVVLFEYDIERHEAVGIKCPVEYSYEGTGYCFIETTAPSIITYSQEDYIGVGKITSSPTIIHVSDGYSFDSVSKEYNDAKLLEKINAIISQSRGGIVDQYTYNQWKSLVYEYGLITN